MVIIPMQVYCTMNEKNEQYEKIRLKIVGGMSRAHQTACPL